MTFGENTNPHPFELVDARAAEHKASESQRKLADELKRAHFAVADAEYRYRRALSDRTKQLHIEGIKTGPSENKGLAITTCQDIARGEESIALLRKERDERGGDLADVQQECFRAAADRKALTEGLVAWSMRRDLRTDAEPADWLKQPAYGRGVPAGVDPVTGEVSAA
jgi:hypothetical protein